MAEIGLTNGGVALVDDEDFEFLSRFSWYKNSNGYAASHGLLMHRLVMGVSDPSIWVDHRNQERLDNRKSNIRKVTSSENQMNSNRRIDNTTGFKGVGKRYGRFYARIQTKEKRIFLGNFGTAEEAAKAYDNAARKYFGEYARVNFPKDDEYRAL